jgi:hypothetical protein
MLATPHWRLPDPPLRASAVAAALLGLVTVIVIADIWIVFLSVWCM